MEPIKVTIKTTPKAVEMLRQLCDATGEKQYRVLERLLRQELRHVARQELALQAEERQIVTTPA